MHSFFLEIVASFELKLPSKNQLRQKWKILAPLLQVWQGKGGGGGGRRTGQVKHLGNKQYCQPHL